MIFVSAALPHLAAFAHLGPGWLGVVPNPAPVAPPGSEKVLRIVGYIKWAALAALIVGFMVGLITFAGGRFVDHHRAGRVGSTMILASLFGALLYGIGWVLISSFAGSQ